MERIRFRRLQDYSVTENFGAPLTSTLSLSYGAGNPTFTRATTATVTDFEGLVKNVKSGEARFEGARRVENLIQFSEDVTIGSGKSAGTSYTGTNVINFANTTDFWNKTPATITGAVGDSYRYSVTLSGSGTLSIYLQTGGGTTEFLGLTTITLTPIPTRYSILCVPTLPGHTSTIAMIARNGGTATSVTVANMQVENVTGQSNQNPSEYVSKNVLTAAPYHGANVDGVKYFTTYNGNTVASKVVIEATGAAIPDATLHGYLSEGSRTNLALQSETLGTTWVPTNLTVTSNSAVAPSGATTADTLTATNANATLAQSVTGTAAGYTFSVWLKRKTGTGTVSISADGTNFTTCDLSGGGWVRCTDTRTLTAAGYNQTIKLSTNGDEVYAWGAQSELGSFASSYIPTTTASVTRNVDLLTYPTAGNILGTVGSVYAEAILNGPNSGSIRSFVGANTIDREILATLSGSTQVRHYDGTNWVGGVSFNSAVGYLNKTAISYGGTSAKHFVNGVADAATAFDGDFNLPTSLSIGTSNSGNYQTNGTVRNVKIWKKALRDAKLISLTT